MKDKGWESAFEDWWTTYQADQDENGWSPELRAIRHVPVEHRASCRRAFEAAWDEVLYRQRLKKMRDQKRAKQGRGRKV